MRTKINDTVASPEELNELYAKGYRYIVDGDYQMLDSIDPWSGMPNIDNNLYAFDNKKEAEAFAVKQIWPFNSEVHATVKRIPEHTETWEETEARWAREKAEKRAKKDAKDAAKAAEAGMTVEEYRKERNRKREVRRTENRIDELEREIGELKAYLERLNGRA